MKPSGVIVTDLLTGEKSHYDTYDQEPETYNSLTCLICMDRISREDKIWCCRECRVPTHLHCIQKWSYTKSVIETQNVWNCPSCRKEFNKLPTRSQCFCGKTYDPEINSTRPQALPHCCRKVCNLLCPSTRGNQCTHPCKSLCHRGLCPPCNEFYSFSCWCGKSTLQTTCSEFKQLNTNGKSCNQLCSKILNCGIHKCEQKCHEGLCISCIKIDSQNPCFCGAITVTKYCGRTPEKQEYQCGSVCNKILLCGLHRCNSKCHPGNCDPCITDPLNIKSCFCGKTSLEELGIVRKSCNDPIPTCGKICGTVLLCRNTYYDVKSMPHKCQYLCHPPPCDPCPLTTTTYCRCKKTQRDISCQDIYYSSSEPVTCKKQCKKLLPCGKHKCERICCPSTGHQCQFTCEEQASCGIHPCRRMCHSGSKHECNHLFNTKMYCVCGEVQVEPPFRCSSQFPACINRCPRKCSSGHLDGHACHRMDQECPPCMYLTSKMCVNNHKMVSRVPCSQMIAFCMTPCVKQLKCGHLCQRFCHLGDCIEGLQKACIQSCRIPRENCKHPCRNSCHFPLPCPISSCFQMIQIMCECKLRVQTITCEDYNWFIGRIKQMNCNFEPKFENFERICLKCNYDCKVKARLRQLADAFKIEPPTKDELAAPHGSPDLNREQLEDILNREYI